MNRKTTPKKKTPAKKKYEGFQKGNKLGGRKPELLKMKGREFILQCIKGDAGLRAIIESAYKRAVRGSVRHQELLLNYILGKPVEKIKLESFIEKGESASTQPVIQIVADHLRLDKLEKEHKAAQVISAERIEEMENVLNSAMEKQDKKALSSKK